jgi:hypothetical protein
VFVAHVPEFVHRRDEYLAEKGRIDSLDRWKEFLKRWFRTMDWPRKSAEQVRSESASRRGLLSAGGRTWRYTSYAYDIDPEARYEYISTLRSIGQPLRSPEDYAGKKDARDGWVQECPFCEIETVELGAEECPQCGRKLVFNRLGD